jgi:3-phenylpropionate/trans-cinnamate dioxygenase ferredoxin subunit
MTDWVDAGDASRLDAAGRTLVRIQGHQIVVFRSADTLHAIDDSCPHRGASLCTGRLDDSGHVRCPAHGLRFRLSDGRMAASPKGAAALTARVYPVRVSDGVIQIQLGGDGG